MSLSRRSLLGLLLAPVPALVVGLVVMSRAGVPAGIWVRNLAATLVGVLVVMAAPGLRALSSSWVAPRRWLIALGLAALGATLMAPGVDDVHRWLGLGPLDIHVGAVLLPSLLVLLTDLEWAPSVAIGLLTLTVLLLQPDAAQAASFGAGWGVWIAMRSGRRAAAPIGAAVLLAGAAWLRHDPLEPVPYVEGIVGMAAGQGTMWGAISLFALALLPIPFLIDPKHKIGTALAVYMTGTLVAAWCGDYPVPVLGYGVSPILGYYLVVVTLRLDSHRVAGNSMSHDSHAWAIARDGDVATGADATAWAAKSVRVVPYDAVWPEVFAAEREQLVGVLGPGAAAIHHMGSTSVPGLCAKPVIDVLVETPDLEMIDRLTPRVESLGYVAKGEYGLPRRRYFSRAEGERLKVHVHVYAVGDEQIGRHLRFRDYLRAHPETAKDYCLLKQALFLEHRDNAEAYQSGKADFIAAIDTEAIRWAANPRSLEDALPSRRSLYL